MSYTKNAYDSMLELLATQPAARERKNKSRAIKHILVKHYPSLRSIDPGVLQAAIKRSQSLDRAWRKVTETHKSLRGSDYDEKDALEANTKRKLGYDV